MSLYRTFGMVCALAAASAGCIASEMGPTYAQRLGWPHGTRAVIFHVDDAGMSYDSNLGAIRATAEGVATSLSIMMPCPWVPHMAAYLKEHPQTDAGLHLTLTAEWENYRWGPVAGKPAVPGLVDPQGCLWPSAEEVVAHASLAEVETEIRAQIDRARGLGLQPTHLDSHMGTCFHEPFVHAYTKVGVEMGIPILAVGGHMQYAGPEVGQFKPLARAMAAGVWKAGLPVLDDVVTQPTKGPDYEQRKQELSKLLTDMQPGVTQIILHCTVPTEVFPQISGSGPAREAELRLMLDPDIRALLQREGIVLTNWRELKARRDAVAREKDARDE
jgi:predicted glycoside hydrolase/deacetylase ChbG (UPF0249 family)